MGDGLGYERRLYDCFSRQDLEEFLGLLHPEIELAEAPELPDAMTHRGPTAALAALSNWPGAFERLVVRYERVAAEGDVVLVETLQTGTPHGTSQSMEIRWYWVHWFSDGLLRRWDTYGDREQAVAAAGFDAAGEPVDWPDVVVDDALVERIRDRSG